MKKYLVKKHFDEIKSQDEIGNVTVERIFIGYEVLYSTDSKSLPRGGDYIFVYGEAKKYPIVVTSTNEEGIETLEVAENESLFNLDIAYEEMDKDIAFESAKKIGTYNRESMFAFVDAYQLRIIAAHKYLDFGLKAEINIASFSIGDKLDTEEKIKEYYTELLVHLDKFRTQKIVDYLTVKAGLEN